MNIASLLTALRHETSARSYIDRMIVVDHSATMPQSQSRAYQEWVGPDNDIYDEVFADVAR
jgi:hypothetical protein